MNPPASQRGSEGHAFERVVSPAPRGLWRELVDRDPMVLPTQTPEWTEALGSTGRYRDVSRLYDFGSGRHLVLPLVRRRHLPQAVALEYSMPNAWGFGGVVGPDARPQELRTVVADLEARNVLGVRLRPNPLVEDLWVAARTGQSRIRPRRAHVLSLEGGFEEVYARRFTSRTRAKIRKAEKAGLHVELDTTGRLVPAFYGLFMRSVDRWAGRQHEPLALARLRARRRDPESKFRQFFRAGVCRLWVAWADGQPAAGILVLQGRNAHYTRGAMDRDLAGPTQANFLLHRLAIEDACNAGCGAYHMGETGSSTSLARFKEAFGARPVEYSEHIIERLPVSRIDERLRGVAKTALRFRDDA